VKEENKKKRKQEKRREKKRREEKRPLMSVSVKWGYKKKLNKR
jgi:hypothetical protein